MYPSRALDNAQGMFHMNSRKFSHRQFSSRDLSEGDEVWGFRKTGKRREGLYESSRAVNLVDGLPRAPSLFERCPETIKSLFSSKNARFRGKSTHVTSFGKKKNRRQCSSRNGSHTNLQLLKWSTPDERSYSKRMVGF